jgi:hypothetical protein
LVPLSGENIAAEPSVLEPGESFVDVMLRDDVHVPLKQQYPLGGILRRLSAEYDVEQASYAPVRRYVRRRHRGEASLWDA